MPNRLPESVTELPTIIVVWESVVVRDLWLATVSGSHGDVAPLLLASPEYTAFQLKEPVAVNVWDAESGTTPLVTVTGVPTVVAVPVQVEPAKNS